MPFFFKPCRMGLGNFISLNDFMGGGLFSPSTSMCHFLRIFSCLDSGISLIYFGGRQLKQKITPKYTSLHANE